MVFAFSLPRRLESLPGLRVGLVWAGKPMPNQQRSMTLAHFATLAKLPGISFVSLQKGAAALEAKSPPPGLVLHDWTDELDDFADTAALIEALDLVISIDTSVAHLAGGLGWPVWIVLKSNPDWRWQLTREGSPWYPTARLFRQHQPGDWDEVMQRIAAELAKVAAGKSEALYAPAKMPPADEPLDRVKAVFSRGFALHRDGALDEAAVAYREAIALDPNHAEAHSNLGVLRHGQNLLDEAIALYGRAIAIKPDHAIALGNLSVALIAKGDVDGAIASLRRAVAAKPEDGESHFRLAELFRRKGDMDDAVASYRLAIAAKPDDARAHFGLGQTSQMKGDFVAAIEAYRGALALEPGLVEVHANLGLALSDAGQIAEGITECQRALALRPDEPRYHDNLAVCLSRRGDLDQAIEGYRRAIGLDSSFASAHANLGLALLEKRQVAEAIDACRRAVELEPDDASYHFILSQSLLLKGDFSEGWQEYEWRLKTGQLLAFIPYSLPVWSGEDIGTRVLLVVHEQGFGDTLQFCRFVTLAAAKARVILAAPRPLVRLLRSLEGIGRVVCEGDRLPACDMYCPVASLPRAFEATLETIPAKVAYLSADAGEVASWRRRLAVLPGLRVGLVWAGNPRQFQPAANAIDRRRSMTLAHFARLSDLQGVSFVSLQKGEPASQTRSPPPGLVVHDWTEELDDFADTAALIEALDLVISVDTSVAHLAGALGKPVWILSRFDGCWRWLLDREDSPWYPSARLFNQRQRGDWDEVIERVADELAQVAAGNTEKLFAPGKLPALLEPPAGSPREAIAGVPSIVPAVEAVLVPVAVGELADKITILEIKAERITDAAKLRNVRTELDQLRAVWDRQGPHSAGLEALTQELKKVNESLWDIEDEIRDCERAQDFGPQFIALARAVYRTNDRRAEIKREINLLLGSNIIEEKSYRDYQATPLP